MKDIRIAVLGGDRRGRLSLLAHRPKEGFVLAAAYSLTPERLGFYPERCGSEFLVTDDYTEILARDDIDVVFICTPDYLHEEHAIAALRQGKHVFLEKPMAITTEGCDRIMQTARETGRKLYVGHNMRFCPVMTKVKEVIDQGMIGTVEAIWCRHFVNYGGDSYFKDWHSERAYTNSLLLQKASHDIDMIHWLAGAYTMTTVGMGKLSVYNRVQDRRSPLQPSAPRESRESSHKNWPPLAQKQLSPNIDVEDHSMILMHLANNVQANYMQCHYTPDERRNYSVIGTEGRVENYGDYSTRSFQAEVHVWNKRCGQGMRGQEVYPIPFFEGDHGGADEIMIKDFLRFLKGEKTIGACPIDARMSVAVGCAATDSIRNGNIPFGVSLPSPEVSGAGCCVANEMGVS